MMFKRVMLILGISLFLPAQGYGGERYSISGNLIFYEAEVICISLYTSDQFKDYRNRPLPPPPFSQIIEPSPEQKRAGRVPFKFSGIPKGTYAIITFRDLNENRGQGRDIQDYFKNPLSYYRMREVSGKWDDMKMEVKGDIEGLRIEFKDAYRKE